MADISPQRKPVLTPLLNILNVRDEATKIHSVNVAKLCKHMAEAFELTFDQHIHLHFLALLHDMGKIGIPDHVLSKPSSLTQEEVEVIQKHPEIGASVIQMIPDVAFVAESIRFHHEWWNGQGYPLGIGGEEIPLESRIIALADAYEAMTSDRPYRNALPKSEALNEIGRMAGVQFDPSLAQRFVEMMKLSAF